MSCGIDREQHSMATDFEKIWLGTFSASLERVAGTKIRKKIMEGSEKLSDATDRQVVVAWSTKAMHMLDEYVQEDKRVQVMTSCACQYPRSELRVMKEKYEETKDIDSVISLLQEKFVSFLEDGLKLNGNTVERILRKRWGLAGYRENSKIIVTKIPKSGQILEYFAETDPVKKRAIYCHCPRIREALKSSTEISPTYCYCGAGYYEGIWEEILQQPVKVELLKSVLKGDEVCSIAVHLP